MSFGRGTLACLLVGLVAPACKARESDDAAAGASAAAQAQSGFHVGDERRYRLRVASDATLQGKPLTQFDLSANWVVRTVDEGADVRLIHTHLEGAKISSKYPEIAAQMKALGPELERPFGIELGRDGKVRGYRFVDAPSRLVVGIRQTIAMGLQASTRAGEASWSSEELDGTGRYRAQYERNADGSLLKQKLAYTALKSSVSTGGTMEALLPKVVSSRATLRIDTGGALESLESSERLSAGSGQIAPIDSATTLSLSLLGTATRSAAKVPQLLATLQSGKRLPAEAVWSSGVNDEQFDPARIGEHTLQSVLAGLRALVAKTEPGKPLPERERADLFTALSAIIRSQPDSRRQVIELVQKNDELTGILLDALGAAGEGESQRALAGFLASPGRDEKQLRTAAIALSHTKNPTPEATDALVNLLDVKGLRTQALYGLGTQVSSLRAAGDETRAKAVLAIVLERLERADDVVKRITALRAVANAGHDDAYPLVVPFLRSEDDDTRAAAVESLQLMQLPQAEEIIARSLSDEKSIVRRAAARAALARDQPSQPLIEAAKSAVRKDISPQVRLMVLRALDHYRPQHPELNVVLQAVAQSDADESIRSEATRMLRAPVVGQAPQASN